jgi:hypothetical protein
VLGGGASTAADDANEEENGGGGEGAAVFGVDTPPVVTLKEVAKVTGEENEKNIFAGGGMGCMLVSTGLVQGRDPNRMTVFSLLACTSTCMIISWLGL